MGWPLTDGTCIYPVSECLGHGVVSMQVYIYIRMPGSWGGVNGGIYIYQNAWVMGWC